MNKRRQIWKFPLFLGSTSYLNMPLDAEVIHFDFQGENPCLWAIVDPDALKASRKFEIYGTGHPLPPEDRSHYLGTRQSGIFVWHLFEIP